MNQPKFQMVKYHRQEYPKDIPLQIQEISANFDIDKLDATELGCSIHTEYSYGKRTFSNSCLYGLDEIQNAHKNGVPQIWKSELWAEQFAEYILRLMKELPAPKVIEIHPPFDDYTEDLETFLLRYQVFEKIILRNYPDVEILVENRCGSLYPGGKFVLSKLDSFLKLSKLIDDKKLCLRFALDIPQLYTAHNCTNEKCEKYCELLTALQPVLHNVAGLHLWGKQKSETGRKVSHCGDLRSYFEEDEDVLNGFLQCFSDVFADGKTRKLVLEVNSDNKDLQSIIRDLRIANCDFC